VRRSMFDVRCSMFLRILMTIDDPDWQSDSASVRITVRVFPVPAPGRRDDLFENRIFWFPPQFLHRLVRGRDQFRRVARAAWFFNRFDGFAGDFLARMDDLANGAALAIPQIVEA